MCQANNGELLTKKNQVLARWKENFEEHLNEGSESITTRRPAAELLKNGGPNLVDALYEVIQQAWTSETLPRSWTAGVLCSVYKKGDKLDCKNYREICLLNVTNKVFTKILYDRLLPHANAALSTLLFNVVLEVIVRRVNLQTIGTIYNKETQLLAYADDIDIVNKRQSAVRDTY
jgi:hypothetical protein